MSGRIRNQLEHIICWAYASGDLVTALRQIRGLDVRFHPLCAWYLNSYVNPDMVGEDDDAPPGHKCYGAFITEALKHIVEEGAPREIPRHQKFDCSGEPPSALLEKIKIDSFLTFRTIKEALAQFRFQPIGASLIVFTELWNLKKGDIYYGPLTPKSCCTGYHGVIIVNIELYRGEIVAVCKSSNGRRVGNGGYFRVSLSTKYMVLGADGENASLVRGTATPQHLLSSFACPVYNDPDKPKRKRPRLPWKRYNEVKKRLCRRDELGSSSHGQDVLNKTTSGRKKTKTTSGLEGGFGVVF